MAVQLPIPVRFEDVFPAGAYVLGVEPINDFEQMKSGLADPQQRDKVTGERLWAVRVLDADPGSRKGQAEVAVKIAARCSRCRRRPLPERRFGRWSSTGWR